MKEELLFKEKKKKKKNWKNETSAEQRKETAVFYEPRDLHVIIKSPDETSPDESSLVSRGTKRENFLLISARVSSHRHQSQLLCLLGSSPLR